MAVPRVAAAVNAGGPSASLRCRRPRPYRRRPPGVSVLFCLTTSLAHGGEGLGTCGFSEHTARQMCSEAGFGTVRRVEMENPFNILYEITI
jgi:hypothetical protein